MGSFILLITSSSKFNFFKTNICQRFTWQGSASFRCRRLVFSFSILMNPAVTEHDILMCPMCPSFCALHIVHLDTKTLCEPLAGPSSTKPKMGQWMCWDGWVKLQQAKNGVADVQGWLGRAQSSQKWGRGCAERWVLIFFVFLSTTPFSGISFLSHVSELIDAANIDVIITKLQTRISTVSSAIPAHPRPHFWLDWLDQAIQAHPRPHFRLA